MKKIATPIILFLFAASSTLFSGCSTTGPTVTEAAIPAEAIQGVWSLDLEDGAKALKFIDDGMWAFTLADPKTGEVVYHHGGTYTFDGFNYVETVNYVNAMAKELLGTVNKFELTLDGDTIHQVGIGNPWTEDWVRVKPQ